MALYVHITDECRNDARALNLESRLDNTKLQIEEAQNLSSFSFLSPAVLKRKIGRSFRLIAWQRAVANDDLIVFLRLLQRRLTDYPHQLEAIKNNPNVTAKTNFKAYIPI